jgi:hypothetical protein
MFRALLLVLAVLTTTAQVCAQDAEALIREGLSLRREGRDREAAERFRAAHEIDRGGRSLAQLALAEQASGQWVAAERDLVRALSMPDRWIAEHRDSLAQALAVIRQNVGRLVVESNVSGAELWIDGQRVSVLPLPEPITAAVGTLVVELRAHGYVPVQRSASIRAGELSRLSVDLVAAPPGTEGTPLASQQTTNTSDASGAGRTPGFDALMGGLVIGGVAILTFGGTLAAIAVREINVQEWNDDSCLPEPRSDRCGPQQSAFITAEHWAIGLGIASGAFAVTSAILLALGFTESSGPTAAVMIAPDAAAASVRVPF